jgi:hypothetical protein
MKTINIKQKTPKILKALGSVSKKVSGAVMGVDLIDGQKRGESIARRILVLITLLLALWVLVDMLVDNGVIKTNNQRRVDSMVEIPSPGPVIALEATEQVEVAHQTTGDIPVVLGVLQPLTQGGVESYVKSYGGRYTPEYLATLRKYCDEDTLKLVVAISVAETSMGKNTSRSTNWYGYFYKGNRGYDPDMETMSQVICNGISKYYSDVDTNYEKAKRYTGNDNTNTWMGNVQKALEQMR